MGHQQIFEDICGKNRGAIYGIIGTSPIQPKGVTCSNGTAFMLAPGILVTAAHIVHAQTDPRQPIHEMFEVIGAADIGQKMENAVLIAEDTVRDIALLKIDNSRSTQSLTLETGLARIGAACGSLGFPLAEVLFTAGGKTFNLVERFQGANISARYEGLMGQVGTKMMIYETDALMYGGSSGCPGFLANGYVFGMHVRSRIDRSTDPQNKDKAATQGDPKTRLAISIWVPSTEIIRFVQENNISL